MSYSTFFEVGGHVIETNVVESGHAARPAATTVQYLSKKTGVPAPLLRKAGKEVQEKTGYDVLRASQAHGRFRRARWAFTTAGALAMADGPLPVGDALAIGFLAAYGTYEIVSGVDDLLQ